MNERIEQLASQAGMLRDKYGLYWNAHDNPDDGVDLEYFAQLIVQECKENFYKVWYEQGMDIRGAELSKFLTRFEEHFGVEE